MSFILKKRTNDLYRVWLSSRGIYYIITYGSKN